MARSRTRTATGRSRLVALLGLLTALLLLVAACEEDPVVDDDPDVDDEEDLEADEEAVEDADPDAVTIGWIPWEENIANTNLWAEILEEEGYDVEMMQLDPGILFSGVADGQIDVFLDVWLPTTHESFWDEYGDQVVDLGTWYEGEATLELTVPAYIAEDEGITSLEDLPDNADLFNNTITGIEAGAGMMEVLEDEVVPTYGLEDYTVQASSTPAMRQELADAIDGEQPILVTLWTPHPEYGMHDLHRLEDPEGAWGDPEDLHGIVREGFEDDFGEVHTWLENFSIGDEDLANLSAQVEEYVEEGDVDDPEREAARDWIEDNRDLVDEWLEG